MKCPIPMLPCSSSQLKEFGFDPATNTLAIRFHPTKKAPAGSVYTYANVTQELYDAMRAADADPEQSVGKVFGERLKGHADKYPFTRIEEDKEDGE